MCIRLSLSLCVSVQFVGIPNTPSSPAVGGGFRSISPSAESPSSRRETASPTSPSRISSAMEMGVQLVQPPKVVQSSSSAGEATCSGPDSPCGGGDGLGRIPSQFWKGIRTVADDEHGSMTDSVVVEGRDSWVVKNQDGDAEFINPPLVRSKTVGEVCGLSMQSWEGSTFSNPQKREVGCTQYEGVELARKKLVNFGGKYCLSSALART